MQAEQSEFEEETVIRLKLGYDTKSKDHLPLPGFFIYILFCFNAQSVAKAVVFRTPISLLNRRFQCTVDYF